MVSKEKKEILNNSLIDKIDELKANAVSDKEFEKTWGKSLNETVDRASNAWDDKLKKYKPKENKDD